MDTYSILRQFADSWMLLMMFSFFAICVLWVFRPGARRVYGDTAAIPFRNETTPATDAAQAEKEA